MITRKEAKRKRKIEALQKKLALSKTFNDFPRT